jgi:Sec-independent protein translocase protein TatA
MFGLGSGEIIVLALVIVVLVRPDSYPRIISNAARMLGRLKAHGANFSRLIEEAAREESRGVDDSASLRGRQREPNGEE